MINREDVSFSETTASSPGSLPKLKVDKETFVYALSLTNESNVPYIDESIYFPTATIVEQKLINNQRVVNMIPIEIGVCTPDDFGKNYQKYLTRLPINSFYCFKNFSVEFEGYSSAENFTMIQIVVNKCNFTENPDKCLSNNDIISKLEGRELMVVSEDFDITPYDFDNPVKERLNINYCPIRMDQYSIFASYYQLTNIETDYNLFGFDYWTSTALDYVLASILSYYLNKLFTFKYHKNDIGSIIKFALNIIVCYIIAFSIARPLTRLLLISFDFNLSKTIIENVAMLVGTGLFMIINYIGQRFFAFKQNR